VAQNIHAPSELRKVGGFLLPDFFEGALDGL